jgi:hypothetical protein
MGHIQAISPQHCAAPAKIPETQLLWYKHDSLGLKAQTTGLCMSSLCTHIYIYVPCTATSPSKEHNCTGHSSGNTQVHNSCSPYKITAAAQPHTQLHMWAQAGGCVLWSLHGTAPAHSSTSHSMHPHNSTSNPQPGRAAGVRRLCSYRKGTKPASAQEMIARFQLRLSATALHLYRQCCAAIVQPLHLNCRPVGQVGQLHTQSAARSEPAASACLPTLHSVQSVQNRQQVRHPA